MSRLIVTPLLLLYSPIGLILVFVRSLLLIYVFLASVILYTVSPVKRIILRFMCSLLGFIVTSEGTSLCSREQPLVSNCVTLFDHMAMNLLTNCVTPHKFMLSWALTWRHLNYDEANCRNKISDIFHIQPEETPTGTNTNVLLKFNPGPFKLFNKVQPVAISVTKYLPINLSIHPIDWKYEIFWVLFSPMIRVHVKFLPPIIRSTDDDQSIDEFIETVRNEIAQNINAKIVDTDKNKFCIMSGEHFPVIEVPNVSNQNNVIEKYDKAVENHARESFISDELNNPRVEQVIAVLPNANPNQVKTLIEKLDDVDSVIAYLLEQTDISNVSNTTTTTTTSISNSKVIHVAPSCHKIAASRFSRQPEERHKSFTERKALFLENARQRYLETHQI